MTAIKEILHKLIETTEDEQLLEDIFLILTTRRENKEGELWGRLSEEQKQEVLENEGEIGDESAWISQAG